MEKIMKYYTYAHYRNDTNEPFYIGKGNGRRAFGLKRGKHWHDIADSRGHTVEILSYWSTEKEAFEHEMFLIKIFREMGYHLANQTDGGEGSSGRTRPLAERLAIGQKMSVIQQGENNSMYGKAPWNKGLKGHPNNGGVKKGDKRPGIGGVKPGNIPWNKGKTGYSTSKKGAKRTRLSIYKQILSARGMWYARGYLIKCGVKHPDEL